MEDRLSVEKRREVLLHIAGCNECAMEYAFAKTLHDAETVDAGCPSSETIALLLDGKLNQEERRTLLLHIADCNACSLEYAFAQTFLEVEEMAKTEGEAVTSGIPKGRIIDWSGARRMAAAAALVLLGFFGRALYDASERSTAVLRGPVQERAPAETRGYESSTLYRDKIDQIRERFDAHLEQIELLSDRGLSTILGVRAVDILTLTPEDIEVYAKFLREKREGEIESAREWVRLDQHRYFTLVDKVPKDVWRRYPAEAGGFEILAWLSDLPEDQKKVLSKLPYEEVRRMREEILREQLRQLLPRLDEVERQ
jgi:hypothetical protein